MSNHHLDNVNTARFSTNEVEVIDVEEPEPPRKRRWWLLVLGLIGAFIIWRLLSAYEAWRMYAGILGAFWFFALGIHPIQAAAHTVGNWFDGDDS